MEVENEKNAGTATGYERPVAASSDLFMFPVDYDVIDNDIRHKIISKCTPPNHFIRTPPDHFKMSFTIACASALTVSLYSAMIASLRAWPFPYTPHKIRPATVYAS